MGNTSTSRCNAKKKRPKSKLGIPDLNTQKPRSYGAWVPRT
jgi:hypothetical protein